MLTSLKITLMTLFYGTSATLTPRPVTLNAGAMTLRAPQPLSPIGDSMQVFVSLGAPNEDQKAAVSGGQFGLPDVGNLRVQICETSQRCLPMMYKGAYLSTGEYGVVFNLTNPAIRAAHFSAVQLDASHPVPHAQVRWQNYLARGSS